jgi:hypothetical protein
MQPTGPSIAPSRQNKSQISAFLEPNLVQAAHKYCSAEHLTLQELIAHAINTGVAQFGKRPFLQVRRERFVNRKKSPAKIQEQLDGIRKGKKRIAAWFENDDVTAVKTFSKEVGLRVEGLVKIGLEKILKISASDVTNQDDWDWSKIETAKLPKTIGKDKAHKTAAAA